jgi:crotonobetainyl-CoA:carnitine CoA-transferase CaiB-like acyl-CoA transferase
VTSTQTATPPDRSGPLAGVRVVDLSIAATGPYACALLADQGAEVVKVERPGIGDLARWVGTSKDKNAKKEQEALLKLAKSHRATSGPNDRYWSDSLPGFCGSVAMWA